MIYLRFIQLTSIILEKKKKRNYLRINWHFSVVQCVVFVHCATLKNNELKQKVYWQFKTRQFKKNTFKLLIHFFLDIFLSLAFSSDRRSNKRKITT